MPPLDVKLDTNNALEPGHPYTTSRSLFGNNNSLQARLSRYYLKS